MAHSRHSKSARTVAKRVRREGSNRATVRAQLARGMYDDMPTFAPTRDFRTGVNDTEAVVR